MRCEAMQNETDKKCLTINVAYPEDQDLKEAKPRPGEPVMERFKELMTSRKFCYVIWARSKNTNAFANTFGISFGESPEEARISTDNASCWQKVPVLDFQSISAETMHAHIAGYLYPKASIFDHLRWDSLKDKKICNPGLESCALAMGPLKTSPWYIAKVLEDHYHQSQGYCPGTDSQLVALLQDTTFHNFLQFYKSTLVPLPVITEIWMKVFKSEEENRLRMKCLQAILQWKKLFA